MSSNTDPHPKLGKEELEFIFEEKIKNKRDELEKAEKEEDDLFLVHYSAIKNPWPEGLKEQKEAKRKINETREDFYRALSKKQAIEKELEILRDEYYKI